MSPFFLGFKRSRALMLLMILAAALLRRDSALPASEFSSRQRVARDG
jgi:hypothetical protein